MEFNEAVNTTVKAIQKGKCLPFIGAGVSASPRYRYPKANQWPTALNHLRTFLKDGQISHQTAHDYADRAAQAADLICECDERRCPPAWFLRLCMLACLAPHDFDRCLSLEISTLADELYDRKPTMLADLLHLLFADGCALQSSHGIHRLLALISFEHIITTNYDGLLEAAHKAIGSHIDSVADDRDLSNVGHRHPLLFKLHGDFRNGNQASYANDAVARRFINNIILTDSHYWKFPNKPRPRRLMVERIRALMHVSRIVFLGYSLSDFNIIEMFHGLSAFQHNLDKPLMVTWETDAPARVALWKARQFDVVECDLDEFVKAVWRGLYGLDIDVTGHERPLSPQLSANSKFEIPIKVMLHRATESPHSMEKVREMARHNVFPARLLQDLDVEDRVAEFIRQNWLRKIESSNEHEQSEDHVFYQWAIEVREGLKNLIYGKRSQ